MNCFCHLTLLLCALTGVVSICTFIAYVLARMKENIPKEERYKSAHYLSLFIFVCLGVAALIMMSNMDL